MRTIVLAIIIFTVYGCSTNITVDPDTLGDPKNSKNYGYHPLDPIPIILTVDNSGDNSKVLNVLPDETIRIAIGTLSREGGITYGPAKIGVEDNSYVVVLDYIKFSTESFGFTLTEPDTKGKRIATLVKKNEISKADVIVPAYIGVGLRLTANIYIKKGKIDLGSLFALGAAAKAEQLSGTLVIQTLGVGSPEITSLVPMPGEISESSIQNAILALASIKAKIHDKGTHIVPRVVGVYNNVGGGEGTINGFISALLQQPITFPDIPK